MGSVLLGGLVRGEIAREKNRFFGHILAVVEFGAKCVRAIWRGRGFTGRFPYDGVVGGALDGSERKLVVKFREYQLA